MKDCTIKIIMRSGKTWQYDLTAEQALKLSSYMRKMTAKTTSKKNVEHLLPFWEISTSQKPGWFHGF